LQKYGSKAEDSNPNGCIRKESYQGARVAIMVQRRFIALVLSGLFLMSILPLFPSESFEPLQQTDEGPVEVISEDQISALKSLPASVKVSGRTGNSTTPPWDFAVRAGGLSSDLGSGIAVDSNGNIYVTGSFSRTASFGNTSLTSGGEYDIFIAKLNNNGDWQWAVGAEGSSSSIGFGVKIVVDSSGNAYATGIFFRTVTFGNTSLSRGSEGYSTFIAKVSNSGSWQWAVDIPSEFRSSMSFDLDGNAYVTGKFPGTATFGSTSLTSSGGNDIFIAKLSSSGSWQWAVKAGGPDNDEGLGIVLDSSGNAYITGGFEGTATFGSTSRTSSGEHDTFIAKLSSDGSWEWAVKAGGQYRDYGQGIAVDSSGNTYVAGVFEETVTFGSTSLVSSGGMNIFIAKLSSSGLWQWAVRGGGSSSDSVYGVAVDLSGNAYVTGYFYGTATFGSTTLVESSYEGHYGTYIAKLNSSSVSWQWAVKAGINGEDDYGNNGVAVDSSGNAYVTGSFEGTITLGSTSLVSSGNYDIFLAKLSSDGSWEWAVKAGGQTEDHGIGIAVDSSGNAYVTGTFRGTATFGSTSLTRDGGSDIFISKLSSSDEDMDRVLDIVDDCLNGAANWDSDSTSDYDSDGCRDNDEDLDDDNDGITDTGDACQIGVLGWTSNLSTDNDADGCQDSIEDMDDDDDGITDELDDCSSGDTSWISKSSTDHDSDGCQDLDEDSDDDNDRVDDLLDLCPHGQLGWFSSKSADFDSDGCQDSSEDVDDDNDGVLDAIEIEAGTNPLDASSKPIESFSVVVGNIELSTWDLIGIVLATLTSGFLAFAFVTRKGRYDAFSLNINDAQHSSLGKLEKKLELASFFRLLSPRQSIKLESLLDTKKEDLGAGIQVDEPVAFPTQESMEIPAQVQPPMTSQAGMLDDKGHEWIKREDGVWYRVANSGSEYTRFNG
jgi:hypothetical protein